MPFIGPAEDRLALRELIETYADAVMRCDADAWGATWAEDAEWALPDYPEIGTTRGRDAIVAMWVGAMTHYPGILFTAWPGSIAVDGDWATMRSYTAEIYDWPDGVHRDQGQYDDACVKIDGQWLFQRRTFRNVHRQIGPKGL